MGEHMEEQMQTQMQAAESERDECYRRIAELTQRAEQAEAALASVRAERDALKRTVDCATAEFPEGIDSTLAYTINLMRQRATKAEAERDALRESLDCCIDAQNELQAERDALKKRIEDALKERIAGKLVALVVVDDNG